MPRKTLGLAALALAAALCAGCKGGNETAVSEARISYCKESVAVVADLMKVAEHSTLTVAKAAAENRLVSYNIRNRVPRADRKTLSDVLTLMYSPQHLRAFDREGTGQYAFLMCLDATEL